MSIATRAAPSPTPTSQQYAAELTRLRASVSELETGTGRATRGAAGAEEADVSDPTDETRPDREALRALIRDVIEDCLVDPSYRDADIEVDALMPAVLALLPAPHPQGGTANRELAIAALRHLDGEGFNDSYLGRNDPNTDDGWHSVEDMVDALLAAAPAPTEGGDE